MKSIRSLRMVSLVIAVLMVFALVSCGGNTKEKTEEPEAGPSLLGKWQTEDGAFGYELLDDGTLLVTSQYGEETCEWEMDGDNIRFIFNDDSGAGYIYNEEKDILVDETDESWYLVRADS